MSAESPIRRNERIFDEATEQGEPVFVVRAKDNKAIPTLVHYMKLTEGDDDMREALEDLLLAVGQWRVENRGLTKDPDVRPG